MTELLYNRVLLPVEDYEFMPIEDMYNKFFKQHYREITRNASTRTQSEVSKSADAMAAADKDRNDLLAEKDEPNYGLVKRRNANGFMMDNLRKHQESSAKDFIVDLEKPISVNHEKYLVILRNKDLVQVASKRVRPVTAKVYEALLSCYETKLHRCKQKIDPGEKFNVTSREILRSLKDQTLDLENSIVFYSNKRRLNNGNDQTAKRLRLDENGLIGNVLDDDDIEFDDEESNENNNDKQATLSQLNLHLDLLADSPLKFVMKEGSRADGEWFVPFDEVIENIKRITYEEILSKKYTSSATRILRVIREKGKLDEKLLSGATLLQSSTIRNLCHQLLAVGALELQEIPRDQ